MDSGHGGRALDEDVGVLAGRPRFGELSKGGGSALSTSRVESSGGMPKTNEIVQPSPELPEALPEEGRAEHLVLDRQLHERCGVTADLPVSYPIAFDPRAIFGMRGDSDPKEEQHLKIRSETKEKKAEMGELTCCHPS